MQTINNNNNDRYLTNYKPAASLTLPIKVLNKI